MSGDKGNPRTWRVVEWKDERGRTILAGRDSPAQDFITSSVSPPLSEAIVACTKGVNVLAAFPQPTLAELVGDAPAFLCEHDDSQCIAYRLWDWRGPGDDGLWHARAVSGDINARHFLLERPLYAFPEIDLSTVVPLAPRSPLHAAAPDLLETLRSCVRLLEWHRSREGTAPENMWEADSAITRARAVIASAEGGS